MGEPPLSVDPRRWGSLVGLVGGLIFIGSCSSALGAIGSAIAEVAGSGLVLAIYAGCVVGELAVIAIGSRALAAAGRDGQRPAPGHRRARAWRSRGPPDERVDP